MPLAGLGLLVVIDADQQDIRAVPFKNGGVFPVFDLRDRPVRGQIPFQLDHEDRVWGDAARKIHNIDAAAPGIDFLKKKVMIVRRKQRPLDNRAKGLFGVVEKTGLFFVDPFDLRANLFLVEAEDVLQKLVALVKTANGFAPIHLADCS